MFGCGGRCGYVCGGVGGGERRCVGGVEKCVERCGGETGTWDECGGCWSVEEGGGKEVWVMWGSVLGWGRCGERCRGFGEVLGEVCDAETI